MTAPRCPRWETVTFGIAAPPLAVFAVYVFGQTVAMLLLSGVWWLCLLGVGCIALWWWSGVRPAIMGIKGLIRLCREMKAQRRPPIFLSTSESLPRRWLQPSSEQVSDHPVLLSPSESLPQCKLLPPGEQAFDNPEDIRRLQDGQQ